MMATTSFAVPMSHNNPFMHPRTNSTPPEDNLYPKGVYGGQVSHTPPSSNISPTNLHSSLLNVRQLKRPRQPLYIPAALRPTDPLTRPTDIPGRPRALDTPPASKDNSFDSAKTAASEAVEARSLPIGLDAQNEDIAVLRHGLSRAASDSLNEELGSVAGPPTIAHWKPDVSSNACAACHQTFTWFFRRHHCRSCGDIVCDIHCKRQVPLDHNARYHPRGTPSKACDVCWREWKLVKKLRHSRTSSLADSQTSSLRAPVPALPIPSQPRRPDELHVGSMARSEGGMVWSTF